MSLLFGLNYNKFFKRSKASSDAVGNMSLSFLGFVGGKLSNIVSAKGLLIESISS